MYTHVKTLTPYLKFYGLKNSTEIWKKNEAELINSGGSTKLLNFPNIP